MNKSNYIFGTITIVSIVGVTAYAIKKSKDAKKAEEQEITLEEAKAMVEQGKKEQPINALAVEVEEDEEEDSEDEIEEETEDELPEPRKVTIKTKEEADREWYDFEEEEEEEENDFEPDYHEGVKKGDEEELRYEPNSIEAMNQFINMELSEFNPSGDIHQTMTRLYDIPFEPKNQGDEMLRTQLIDYRAQFFGFSSKWVQMISMADIICHYARITEFNYGESVGYWINYFLDFNELDYTYSTFEIDKTVDLLNDHSYFNEERATFGIFGLTRESMDQACKNGDRSVYRTVTYEMEFNEFLKSCV